MTFPPRRLSGQVLYLDGAGREWGRETFSDTIHAPGLRTRRALCEMDEARLHREASWTLGADWRPREGFVRNVRQGETIGSCWYRIDGAVVECEGLTADHGRVSRRLEAPRPIEFLGFHPLSGDCITAMVRGTDAPGEERELVCAANSIAYLGDEGLDVRLTSPVVAYLGEEEIAVRAGTFAARHYTIRWSDAVPLLTHFWIEPADCLPLLTVLPENGERYELVRLERG